MTALRRRAQARVEGTVQGVGFRPYVYRLAEELGLAGYVLNDAHGVLLEVEGDGDALDEFLYRLGLDAPPLATIERVIVSDARVVGDDGFVIRPSPRGDVPDAPVSADAATCSECLGELFDQLDRRYRYPFINCTNCGPRFTIVRGIPYDRPFTTMAGFVMCGRCQAEYDDPADRRFHAQPNACPECGPRLSLVGCGSEPVVGDPIAAAAAALRGGAIVAVKGVGGFHLACLAGDEAVVSRLRARKHREDKPFALMARDLASAEALVELTPASRALLTSQARPIVLAARRARAPVAASAAPDVAELGVMLPYSPLHHLLLEDVGGEALVLTSGNVSDEPIAYRDDDVLARLTGIADLFLVHDRPIETRTDDSVVRVVSVGARSASTVLRRSRGFVPESLPLPGGAPGAVLAVGAELKNTFCVAKGERAWVSHHIGDLKNYETLISFAEGVRHFERLFSVAPEVVAHDLHPDYMSTRYALERPDVELAGVQHHHAHLAACLAEHGYGPGVVAVGAIFDGAGYGGDGTVWGGELLVGDVAASIRVGHLRAVPLPGGDRAARQPWRMACAWLAAALGTDSPSIPPVLAGAVDRGLWRQVAGLARAGLNSPPTTSMGRLFDAVAALCGLGAAVTYEGQAAIALEAACDPHERGCYPLEVAGGAMLCLDARETVSAAAADVAAGTPVGVVAARFHAAVAGATVEACGRAAATAGTDLAVLSGGVFQNRRLLESVCAGLGALGLRVLVPERLPAGDGGISFGQAAVAAVRLRAGGGLA